MSSDIPYTVRTNLSWHPTCRFIANVDKVDPKFLSHMNLISYVLSSKLMININARIMLLLYGHYAGHWYLLLDYDSRLVHPTQLLSSKVLIMYTGQISVYFIKECPDIARKEVLYNLLLNDWIQFNVTLYWNPIPESEAQSGGLINSRW
jgi:hypothetical protein